MKKEIRFTFEDCLRKAALMECQVYKRPYSNLAEHFARKAEYWYQMAQIAKQQGYAAYQLQAVSK